MSVNLSAIDVTVVTPIANPRQHCPPLALSRPDGCMIFLSSETLISRPRFLTHPKNSNASRVHTCTQLYLN